MHAAPTIIAIAKAALLVVDKMYYMDTKHAKMLYILHQLIVVAVSLNMSSHWRAITHAPHVEGRVGGLCLRQSVAPRCGTPPPLRRGVCRAGAA